MGVGEWQGVIQGATPAIVGFMAACLVITLVGAVVRSIVGAINGPSSDD